MKTCLLGQWKNQEFTEKTVVMIPKYLGLVNLSPLDDGKFRCVLGYTKAIQTSLILDRESLGLLCEFCDPASPQAVAKRINKGIDVIMDFAKTLISCGVLAPTYEMPPELERYDRHLLYYHAMGADPREVQQKLSGSRIAIVGMGGIGNWVSAALIGHGFKELRLFDFDVIETSNLTRQILFSESDVGLSKLDIAAKRLRERNGKTEVSYHEIKVDGPESLAGNLSGIDFLVLSADRPREIHGWVDDVCRINKIPYTTAGYIHTTGSTGPIVVHGETGCYFCHQHKRGKTNPLAEDVQQMKMMLMTRIQAPSYGGTNAIIGTNTAIEAVKFVTGYSPCLTLGRIMHFHPDSNRFQFIDFPRSSDCPKCGQISAPGSFSIDSLNDL